jgi:adenylylsulfate reductase subunit A
MTTVRGLFAAGDGVSGSPHKFSSGSYTEGRLAAKAAVAYVRDNPEPQGINNEQVITAINEIALPLAIFEGAANKTTNPDVNPEYLLPKQALVRLQKIMDEYGAGRGARYTTNEPMLLRALELLDYLRVDLERLAARDLHDLLRCRELRDRYLCAEAHLRHMLFRKETRWPGFYSRADYPHLDDRNWLCFVNSQYDSAANEWHVMTKPYLRIIA